MEDGGKEPFSELNRILDSLKQRDLGPALEWAQSHRESLDTQVNTHTVTAFIQHSIQNVCICRHLSLYINDLWHDFCFLISVSLPNEIE
jgi:hypothetical protein